jgi:pSer/pThr/pTyr-binding forkhead associated (FHA) protein
MELGLACSVCSHLNPLRAATCDRCHAALAPRMAPAAVAGSVVEAAGRSALHRSPAAPAVASSGAVTGPQTGAKGISTVSTMQLPTVQPAGAQAIPAAVPQAAPPQVSTLQDAAGPARANATVFSAQAAAPRFNALTGLPEGPASSGKPAAKTMFFGALQQQAVVPRLVVIKGEGGDGVTYHLSATNHTVGRATGDIRFSEDLFLNPEHARFTVQGGRLFVKDMGSVNGVFVRIKSPVQLEHGDYFLVGEQLLRLDSEAFSDGGPDPAGTYSYSSPRPEGRFRVVQQLAGGGEGRIVSAQGAALTMGRESNTLNFPNDRFISGRHARLDAASDTHHVILTDTGSRNGTFIRTKGALELFHGDYLFVGQQLLRVEIS